jgi:hypothetical protein
MPTSVGMSITQSNQRSPWRANGINATLNTQLSTLNIEVQKLGIVGFMPLVKN